MLLKKIARALTIGAIALTGVGLIYLLARTYFVRNNHVGLVVDYNADNEQERVRVLEPGIHLLLSPFKSFEYEVSKQDQIQPLPKFYVKTKDNVDTYIEADFTYQIENPQATITKVADFSYALNETVKSAFSSAIQELTYQAVTSIAITELAALGGHQEKLENSEHPGFPHVSLPSKEHHLTGAEFFRQLMDRCQSWGVKIINFRIISVEAKHLRVSEALELTAEADVRAVVQAKAAKSQADMIKTLATAEKEAQMIRAEGAREAAKILLENPVAQQVYEQTTRIQMAEALGRSKNNLVLGMGSTPGFDCNPFMTFTDTNKARSNVAQLPAPTAQTSQKVRSRSVN